MGKRKGIVAAALAAFSLLFGASTAAIAQSVAIPLDCLPGEALLRGREDGGDIEFRWFGGTYAFTETVSNLAVVPAGGFTGPNATSLIRELQRLMCDDPQDPSAWAESEYVGLRCVTDIDRRLFVREVDRFNGCPNRNDTRTAFQSGFRYGFTEAKAKRIALALEDPAISGPVRRQLQQYRAEAEKERDAARLAFLTAEQRYRRNF